MNIENATAEELIRELGSRLKEGSIQYHYYPDGSVEKKQIIQASIIPNRCLKLLKKGPDELQSISSNEKTLKYVKGILIEEQNKRLKELNLSQQFLNGGIECTISA